MDYEKKYKEALKRAEKALEVLGTDKCEGARQIFSLFPELKESEDERIRKGLVKAVSGALEGTKLFGTDVTRDEALAWLEKQGEQNPAWTKEDESNLQGIIYELQANKSEAPEYDIKIYDKFIDWLKSLKQRIGWKPSDEQIMCLQDALSDYHRRGYKAETLETLLKQLKQL